MYELLIKGGTIVTSHGRYRANIVAEGGVIVGITKQEPEAERVIDAKGKMILPGIIDMHTHLRDPGYTHKEDFETGTRAAAAGGVTFVSPQPNLDPVPNNVERYRKQIEIGEKKSLIDFNPPASPLLYEEGWVPKLAEEGAAYFKIFQKVAAYPYDTAAGTTNTAHIYRAFKEIAKTGLYCSIHPFNKDFFDEVPLIMKKQGIPMTLPNYARRIYAEEEFTSAAYQLYYLAKKAGMKWYALHAGISLDYLELVRKIKASTEWYVIASAEALLQKLLHGRLYDVKREEWFDMGRRPVKWNLIWRAIKDGTIDFLGTDHAPHLREEMEPDDPLKAHMGQPLLEWYGHLLLNEVNRGSLALDKLVEVTSENAAKIFGFYPQKGAIQVGSDADFTISDLDREWTINSERVYTKCQINPFHGLRIRGKVTHTIVRGQVIMEEGEIIGKPGYGKFIRPKQRLCEGN